MHGVLCSSRLLTHTPAAARALLCLLGRVSAHLSPPLLFLPPFPFALPSHAHPQVGLTNYVLRHLYGPLEGLPVVEITSLGTSGLPPPSSALANSTPRTTYRSRFDASNCNERPKYRPTATRSLKQQKKLRTTNGIWYHVPPFAFGPCALSALSISPLASSSSHVARRRSCPRAPSKPSTRGTACFASSGIPS